MHILALKPPMLGLQDVCIPPSIAGSTHIIVQDLRTAIIAGFPVVHAAHATPAAPKRWFLQLEDHHPSSPQ